MTKPDRSTSELRAEFDVIKYSVDTGRMTQQQAESFFNLNSYMLQASIGALVAGVVTTLVLAAIMRSKSAVQAT
jgi:hypothetical protein